MWMRARATWDACSIWPGASTFPFLRGAISRSEATPNFPPNGARFRTIFRVFRCRLRPRPPENKRAADYLVERLRNAPTPVQILALGPLTNIAEALERDRSIAAHIQEIVIMGGAVRVPGNLQDGGVSHQEQHCRMEHVYRSDGGAHCLPFGRTNPADRAGCHQQS